MSIYKTIDLPNWPIIADKVYDYIKRHEEIYNSLNIWIWFDYTDLLKEVPEIEESIASVGLTVSWLSIIKCKPNEGFHLHADGYDPGDPMRARILAPIKNCEGSFTNFHSVPRENMTFWTAPDYDNPESGRLNEREGFSLHYYLVDESKGPYEKIDSLTLTSPVVFDSSTPHQVINNPDIAEARFTMTIETKESLVPYLDDSFVTY